MTVVVGQKFQDRIALVADTMISHYGQVKLDAIPGALKIVCLNDALTIAFANNVDPAIRAIRRCNKAFAKGCSLDDIISLLEATLEADFLVASHLPKASLIKIEAGKRSQPLQRAWIGSADAVDMVSNVDQHVAQFGSPVVIDGIDPRERVLKSAFLQAFQKLGINITPGVGGIPVLATISPYGHCYDAFGAASNWDEIKIGPGVPLYSKPPGGHSSWQISVVTPPNRGVAVLGVAIVEAGIGFIYSPMDSGTDTSGRLAVPILVKLPMNDKAAIEMLRALVADAAKKLRA